MINYIEKLEKIFCGRGFPPRWEKITK